MPSRSDILTRSASERACIFFITWPRCTLTVISLVPSSAAACLLSNPATTRPITACSRGVRDWYRSFSSRSPACSRRAARSRVMASRIAVKRSSSPKGFVRNSTAPAFIARTDVGTSPWPVMKMIGISRSISTRRRWRSRPERPGSWTSNTRQLGPSARGPARNSCALAYVTTPNPAARKRPPSASRTDASSSTTKTVASGLGIALLRPLRHGEVKRRAGTIVGKRPQLSAVILDDGTADRKPHAHASRLGGVKSVEDVRRAFGVEAYSRVLNRHACLTALDPLCLDDQHSRPISHPAHGFDRIHHEVQHHLLQLHAITQHGREIVGELGSQKHPIAADFTLGENRDFLHGIVQVQRLFLGIGLLRQRTNPPDHLTGPIAVTDNPARRFAGFLEIGCIARQPPEARTRVGHDPRQRLVHFVRDGS